MKIIPIKEADIDEIADVLRNDGTLVVPTDTVYGLTASAKSKKAGQKILSIKKRPEGKTLSIFIPRFSAFSEVAEVKDERIMKILKKVWPGKTTCVLPARGWIPFILRGKKGLTIGVRVPDYPWLWKVMEKFGGPIIGTSANVSGFLSHTKIKEVIEEFSKLSAQPDLIIDAGELVPSEPSAVLDCTVYPPEVLRGDGGILKELRD